jgi:hypothetical protein
VATVVVGREGLWRFVGGASSVVEGVVGEEMEAARCMNCLGVRAGFLGREGKTDFHGKEAGGHGFGGAPGGGVRRGGHRCLFGGDDG